MFFDKGRRIGIRRSFRLCSLLGRGLCLRTGPGRFRFVGKFVGSSLGRFCIGWGCLGFVCRYSFCFGGEYSREFRFVFVLRFLLEGSYGFEG